MRHAYAQAQESLLLAKEVNAEDVLNEIHEFLADAYADLGKHEAALHHFKLYKDLREALLYDESQERIEELKVHYELAEKNREIASLELDTLKSDARLRQQAGTKNFAIAASLVLLLFVVCVALGYRAQRRARISLQQAHSELKVLRGLLPICAACKRIRNAKGQWSALEAYISDHSEARFTHGMCEECTREWYPELTS